MGNANFLNEVHQSFLKCPLRTLPRRTTPLNGPRSQTSHGSRTWAPAAGAAAAAGAARHGRARGRPWCPTRMPALSQSGRAQEGVRSERPHVPDMLRKASQRVHYNPQNVVHVVCLLHYPGPRHLTGQCTAGSHLRTYGLKPVSVANCYDSHSTSSRPI